MSEWGIAKVTILIQLTSKMNKIFNFIAQSNRYKHLIGGFFVAAFGGALYPALYATIVAASCLELKDCLYGNDWDWLDWICTIAGGIIAASLFYILIP
jgi:hypothetical protein